MQVSRVILLIYEQFTLFKKKKKNYDDAKDFLVILRTGNTYLQHKALIMGVVGWIMMTFQ